MVKLGNDPGGVKKIFTPSIIRKEEKKLFLSLEIQQLFQQITVSRNFNPENCTCDNFKPKLSVKLFLVKEKKIH